MALTPVSDPDLIARLEGGQPRRRPVSPEIAQQLDAQPSIPMAPRDLVPEQVFPMTAGGMKDQFDTALGTLFTYSDEGVKNIWSKQLQESGVEHEWLSDEQGNDILRYRDRDGNWQQGYINAPGFSGADALKPSAGIGAFGNISNILTGAAGGLARLAPGVASRVIPAATSTMARRGAITGAEAAISQGAIDEIAQQTGADVPASERLTNASIAAGFGFIAEPVAMLIGKGIGSLWQKFKGGPTAQQAQAAREMVLGSVDDATRSVLDKADDAYWRDIAQYADNVQSADDLRLFAMSEAYRREIPGFQAFKPYVTQNLDDWTQFDEAIRGGYGPEIQRQTGQAARANERAIASRIETLKPQATGGPTIADDAATAGGILREGVSRRADDLWQQIDDAYRAAGDMPGGFNPQAGQYLDDMVASRLQEGNFLGRQGRLPTDATKAADALGEIQDIVAAMSRQGDDAANLSFREFEATRRYLSGLRSSAKGSERATITAMVRAYDDWADNMVDMAMYHGDDAALQAFKDARALRAEYGSKFGPQDTVTRSGRRVQDRAGKVMEDIVELDLGPEQVVGRVFGGGQLGRSPESVEILRRMEKAVGRDSAEWKAMQEAGYMRIFYDNRGRPRSATQIVNEWDGVSQGDGKYWARRLFGDDGMATMGRFVGLLRQTQMPREAYNASGPAIRKNMQSLWGRMASILVRLKMPLASQWADNAISANAASNLTRAGETAIAAPQLIYMPNANLSQAVTAAGVSGSAPAAQSAQGR